jgi:serralysin
MAIVSDYTAVLAYLDNDVLRWNGMTAVGTPVIVTYSFVETADLPDPAESNFNVSAYWSYSEVQRDYFRQVAAQYEAVAGIILVEVTGEAMVNIRGANVSGVGGWASLPVAYDAFTSQGGLVNGSVNMEPGRYGYQVNLHEFGHSMGLEHPHQDDSATLDPDLDTQANSVMTYNIRTPYATDLAPFDKQALVHLYGSVDLVADWQVTVIEDGSIEIVGSDRGETMIAVDRAAWLDAGLGNDTIFGRDWQDTLIGGAGDDAIAGGDGGDMIVGGVGRDTLHGDGGADLIVGGSGHDLIDGGDGQDTLLGGSGDDTIDGGANSDLIEGGLGNDLLNGGSSGGDTLVGGAGEDTLVAMGGNDVLIGGEDADTFVFETEIGYIKVVVEDFEQGIDRLDYTAFLGTSWADVEQFNYHDGEGVLVYVDTNHPYLVLTGMSQGSLLETDFLFA